MYGFTELALSTRHILALHASHTLLTCVESCESTRHECELAVTPRVALPLDLERAARRHCSLYFDFVGVSDKYGCGLLHT